MSEFKAKPNHAGEVVRYEADQIKTPIKTIEDLILNTPDEEMQKDFELSGSVYPKVEAAFISAKMGEVKYDVHVIPGTTTTVITAYIPIGPTNFSLCTEIMACVDPRNFNAEKGAKYGIEKAEASARNELWKLEGYLLSRSMFTS